jgi:flagellar basal-body rod protein FlgB
MPMPVQDQRLDVLSRLLDVAMQRERVHLGNLANQNTPGYKTKALEFEQAFNEAIDAGSSGDDIEPEVVEQPGYLGQPDGNNVSSEREVAALAKNQLMYNAYLAMTKGKMRLYTTAIATAPGG